MASSRRAGAGLLGLRALLGAVLLLGFYVLAAVLVVLVVGGIVGIALAFTLIFHVTGGFVFWFLIGTTGGGLALLRGAFGRMRAGRDGPGGLAVSETVQPRLWAEVRELAAEVGAPAPRVIRIAPDANAAVHQRVRLFGLVRGRVTLVVGMALLNGLDRAELRAVLAHEFGHISGGDTRLGPLVYRSQSRLVRTIAALHTSGKGLDLFLARIVGLYLRLCLRVTAAVSRAQERAADASAARVAGPETTAAALTAVGMASELFASFTNQYVVRLWQAGRYPDDLYGGLRKFTLAAFAEGGLEQLRQRVLAAPSERWDTHPSVSERLALLAEMPASTKETVPDVPARGLLENPDKLERTISLALARDVTGLPEPAAVDWDAAAEIYGRTVTRSGARLADAGVRVGGRWDEPGFDQALEMLAAGRGAELAAALHPKGAAALDAEDERRTLHRALVAALPGVLVAEHGARWKTSWTAVVEIEWAGTPITDLADMALVGPDGVAVLRAELGRPAVDLTPVPPLEEPAHAG
ncbi:M48 family metallopeptidase [Actinomadura rupiterrae]|uniref:M48 family metallopeptidase n=1 Tax=Actinomadura rupiterrae TaxID=559627 RepID=UPI0020A53577|nr:M48 family metallopeptidase [Actinomadura rupiterrae]MCP2335584.1 Zn-dependent protease with chaperone function [Actinomadura rupiterrae]